MERKSVRVAVTQLSCSLDSSVNVEKAQDLVKRAAADGAQIILLQELFQTLYICQEQKAEHLKLASSVIDNALIEGFRVLARQLKVVLPISFFEKYNNVYYNSIAIIDADGLLLGVYRKSHIPDGPGYQEKFYFSPGDTGFKVFKTQFATIGCGICWDQWFPECARAMTLLGAEILLYPTAIGSEPEGPGYDSQPHWERAMVGHSACNMIPVIASNRVGTEIFPHSQITFYGSSFITDNTGKILHKLDRSSEGFVAADLDLAAYAQQRSGWGLFRDRRPDLYGVLLTKDGHTHSNK